jgi:hypothetical protein
MAQQDGLEKWKAAHGGKTPEELLKLAVERTQLECAKAICNHCGDIMASTRMKEPNGRWIHKFKSGAVMPCDAWKIWEFV